MDIQKQADIFRRLEDSRELELCKQQLVSYESRCEVAESKLTSLNRRFSDSQKVKNSQQQLKALRAEKQEALSRANVLIADKKAELLDYEKQVQQAQERVASYGARTQVPGSLSPAQPNSGAAAPPPTPAGPSSHTEPRFGGNRVVLEAKLVIAEWKCDELQRAHARCMPGSSRQTESQGDRPASSKAEDSQSGLQANSQPDSAYLEAAEVVEGLTQQQSALQAQLTQLTNALSASDSLNKQLADQLQALQQRYAARSDGLDPFLLELLNKSKADYKQKLLSVEDTHSKELQSSLAVTQALREKVEQLEQQLLKGGQQGQKTVDSQAELMKQQQPADSQEPADTSPKVKKQPEVPASAISVEKNAMNRRLRVMLDNVQQSAEKAKSRARHDRQYLQSLVEDANRDRAESKAKSEQQALQIIALHEELAEYQQASLPVHQPVNGQPNGQPSAHNVPQQAEEGEGEAAQPAHKAILPESRPANTTMPEVDTNATGTVSPSHIIVLSVTRDV